MTTPHQASGSLPDPRANDGAAQARLLDQIHEVVFTTDAQGRVQYVNAAWTRMTGFPAESLIGQDLTSFVLEDERDHCIARQRHVLDGRRATTTGD